MTGSADRMSLASQRWTFHLKAEHTNDSEYNVRGAGYRLRRASADDGKRSEFTECDGRCSAPIGKKGGSLREGRLAIPPGRRLADDGKRNEVQRSVVERCILWAGCRNPIH